MRGLRLKEKKSQIKIQEMSFMLIALAIFFAIIFLFYLAITTAGLKKEVQKLERQSSIGIVARLADAPEFNCEGSYTVCIDTDKLLSFMERKENYQMYWGESVKGLVIKKIFSFELFSSEKEVECIKGNYPGCNTFTIIPPANGTIADASYVALCRLEYKNQYNFPKCGLGKIIIYTRKER